MSAKSANAPTAASALCSERESTRIRVAPENPQGLSGVYLTVEQIPDTEAMLRFRDDTYPQRRQMGSLFDSAVRTRKQPPPATPSAPFVKGARYRAAAKRLSHIRQKALIKKFVTIHQVLNG